MWVEHHLLLLCVIVGGYLAIDVSRRAVTRVWRRLRHVEMGKEEGNGSPRP